MFKWLYCYILLAVWLFVNETFVIRLFPSAAGWEPIPELLEAFRTEFALRLFWGQTGAEAPKKERYEKFEKILTVLSNKLEPSQTSEL